MSAEDLLRQGDLSGALAALQDGVRKAPADAKLRIFLFQLLAVMGDWKRAVTQLKVCAELDKSALAMAQTYREAIICEVYREKVFAGEKSPLVFGQPPEWVAWQIEALKALAAGRATEAADLRARAFDAAPATPGTINGAPFEWVADADMRLGPLIEIIVNGRYFWAPFSAIHKLEIDPPTDLRDRVWTPAHVVWSNGGDTVALIPTRYAGTTAKGDDALKMARMTVWEDLGAETFAGFGGRLLATDAGDTALMDLRSLVIGEAPEVAPADAGETADG
ncbi:MAG: type VI secretion system accessory protein TagJ [Thermohalobaculum sp.]|nr:type VI secretion system accessory protein TagJ [Thermohalobaculum sp.]